MAKKQSLFTKDESGNLKLNNPEEFERIAHRANTSKAKTGDTYLPGELWSPIQKVKKELHMDWYPNHGLNALEESLLRIEYRDKKKAAEEQGFFGELKGFLAQTVLGEIALGIVGGIGYALDLENWYDLATTGQSDWSNWLSDLADSGQEHIREWAPIHVDPDAETRTTWENMMHTDGWWFSNGVSVASSFSMMIPAIGIARGLSLFGKAVRGIATAGKLGKVTQKGVSAMDKLMKANPSLKTLVKAKDAFTTASISRHIENQMEAAEVFKSSYESLMAKGVSEKDARKAASEGAAFTYKTGWANMLTDLPQYMLIGRGFKTNKAIFHDKVAKMAKKSRVKAGALRFSKYGAAMASEGAEELFQYVVAEEGKHLADIKAGLVDPNETTLSDRIDEYLDTSEAWTATLFGALGGGIFQGFGPGVRKGISKLGGQTERRLTEKELRVREIVDRQTRTLADVQAYHEALEIGDERAAEVVKSRIGTNLGINAARVGNLDMAIADLERLKNADPQEREDWGFGDDYHAEIDRVVEDAKFAAQKYAENMDKYYPDPNINEALTVRQSLLRNYNNRIPQLQSEIDLMKQEIPMINDLSANGKLRFETMMEIQAMERYLQASKTRLEKVNEPEETKENIRSHISQVEAMLDGAKQQLANDTELKLTGTDKTVIDAASKGMYKDLSIRMGELHHIQQELKGLHSDISTMTSDEFQDNLRKKAQGIVEAQDKQAKTAEENKKEKAKRDSLNDIKTSPEDAIHGSEEVTQKSIAEIAEEYKTGKRTWESIPEAFHKQVEEYLAGKSLEDSNLEGLSPEEREKLKTDHQAADQVTHSFEEHETPENPTLDETVNWTYDAGGEQVVQAFTPLAWLSSNSDSLNPNKDLPENVALTNFLEGDYPMAGINIRFELDLDYLYAHENRHRKGFAKIKAALDAGQELPNDLLGRLPIKGHFYRNNKPVVHQDHHLRMHLHDANFFFDKNSAVKEAQASVLLKHKKQILDAHKNGQILEAPIINKSNGHIITDTNQLGEFAKNNVSDVLGQTPDKISFAYGNNTDAYLTEDGTEDLRLISFFSPTAGAIYAVTKTANGTHFPLRLHASNLDTSEATLIHQLYADLLGNFELISSNISQEIIDYIEKHENPVVNGLGNYLNLNNTTYGELLNDLVYEGRKTESSGKGRLFLSRSDNSINFFNKKMTKDQFLSEDGKFEFIEFLKENRRRQITAKNLKDPKYKEYVVSNEILTTNAKVTDTKRFFIQPNIEYGSDLTTVPTTMEVGKEASPLAKKKLARLGFSDAMIQKMTPEQRKKALTFTSAADAVDMIKSMSPAPVKPEVTKKSDIERRRQEELNSIGKKQIQRALQDLKKATSEEQIAKAIFNFEKNVKAGAKITEEERNFVDQKRQELKDKGFEIVDVTGEIWSEGMNLRITEAKTLREGENLTQEEITALEKELERRKNKRERLEKSGLSEEEIDREFDDTIDIMTTIEPQINKEGKMVKSAEARSLVILVSQAEEILERSKKNPKNPSQERENKINAKYDAELAALETTTPEMSEEDAAIAAAEGTGFTIDSFVSEDTPIEDREQEKKDNSDFRANMRKKGKEDRDKGDTGAFKLLEGPTETGYNISKEIDHIRRLLPKAIAIELTDDFIQITSQGLRAQGMFKNGMAIIAENAGRGTAYHEAFHAVFRTILPPQEQRALLAEAKETYEKFTEEDLRKISQATGVKNREELINLFYEEILANEFANYMMIRNPYKAGLGPKVRSFFDRLILWMKEVFSRKSVADKLFKNIRKGEFQNRTPRNTRGVAYSLETNPVFDTAEVHEITTQLVYAAFKDVSSINDFHKIDLSNIEVTVRQGYNRIFDLHEAGELSTEEFEMLEEKYTDIVSPQGSLKPFWQRSIDNYIETVLGLKKAPLKDQKIDTEDDFDEEMATDKEVQGWAKANYEISGKDNATAHMKFLIGLLPKVTGRDANDKVIYDRSGVLGLPKFVDFSTTWHSVETTLLNTTAAVEDNGDVFKTMLKKLEAESKYKPELGLLAEKLHNSPEHVQSQFHALFSRQKGAYWTHLIEGKVGDISSRFSGEDLEAKDRVLFNTWAEKFEDIFGRYNDNGDLIYRPEAIVVFNQKKAALKQSVQEDVVSGTITEKTLDNFLKTFNGLGIDISPLALAKLLDDLSPAQSQNMPRPKALSIGARILFLQVDKATRDLTSKRGLLEPKTNQITNNARVFKNMVGSAQAQFESISGENIFIGPGGNKIWFYQANNMTSKIITQFKNGDKSYLNMLKEGVYHQNSIWLNRLLEEPQFRENFSLAIYGNNKQVGTGDRGAKAADLKPVDQYHDIVTKTLNGMFIGLAEADKTQQSYFHLGKENIIHSGISYAPRTGDPYFDNAKFPAAVKILADYLGDELRRIKAVNQDFYGYTDEKGEVHPPLAEEKQILNYHYVIDANGDRRPGNGFNTFLFPNIPLQELGLANDNGDIRTLDKNTLYSEAVRKYIGNELLARVKEEIQTAEEMQLISRDKENHLVNRLLDKSLVEERGGNIGKVIGDYVFNSIVANVEQTKLFNGDPALYKVKGLYDKKGNPINWSDLDIFGDFKKRIPASNAAGTDMRTFQNPDGGFAVRSQYSSAVIENIIEPSDYFTNEENLKAIADASKGKYSVTALKKLFAPYKEVNRTDAQAWITVDVYRERMRGYGKWTPEHENAYNKILDDTPLSIEETALLAMPLKTVHAELKKHYNGSNIFHYNKQSEAVLLPQLTRGTQLDALRQAMEKQKVDHVIVLDGKKVGATGIISAIDENGNILKDIKFNPTSLSYSNLFLQQDLNTKEVHDTLVASQSVKNVLQVLDLSEAYLDGSMTGQEVYDLYHEIISKRSNLGKDEFQKKVGWSPEERFKLNDNGSNYIYHEVLKRELQGEVSNNHLQSLGTKTDLNAYPIRQKFMNKANTMATKSSIRLKQLGGAFVQLSDFGLIGTETEIHQEVKDGIVWLKDPKERLQPMKAGEKQSSAAQILLPYREALEMVNKMLPKGTTYQDLSGDQIKAFFEKASLEGFSYRIPNQGAASNDAFEIVGFLPPQAGDTIVSFSEITAKTGSDFDIDKAYIILPHLTYDKTTKTIYPIKYNPEKITKKGLDNQRLTLMREMLLHPSAFVETMTSIDDNWLSNYAAEYFPEASASSDLQFFSGTTQLRNKQIFDNAKNLVGVIANHMSHHNLIMHEDLYFNDYYLGKGKANENGTTLSNQVDEDGNNIATTLGIYMNAIVDAAKDPFISRMNINQQTAGVAFTLVRAGVSRDWIAAFMGQPILRRLVEFTNNSEGRFSENIDVQEQLLQEFDSKLDPKDLFSVDNSLQGFENGDIKTTTKQLQKELTTEEVNNDLQVKILAQFLQWRKPAKTLNNLINISKVDVNGATRNLTRANLYMNFVYSVIAEDNIGNLENFLGYTYDEVGNLTFDNSPKMIGTYINNGPKLVLEMFKDQFLETTLGGQVGIAHLAAHAGYTTLGVREEHERLADIFANELFNALASKTELFGKPMEERLAILFGDPQQSKYGKSGARAMGLGDRLKQKKNDPEYRDNLLIKSLQVTNKTRLLPAMIQLPQNETIKDIKDILYESWEELFAKDETFAEDLVQYSFMMSGFSLGLKTFHEHIPMKYLKDANYDFQLRNIIDRGIDNASAFVGELSKIYKHLYMNDNIVPTIPIGKIIDKKYQLKTLDGVVFPTEVGFQLPITEDSYIAGVNSFNEPVFKPFIKIKRDQVINGLPVTNTFLYELRGYSKQGNAVYTRTNKLGALNKGLTLKEYAGDGNSSIFVDNNVPAKVAGILNEPMFKNALMEKRDTIVAPYDKHKVNEYKSREVISDEDVNDQLNFCLNT